MNENNENRSTKPGMSGCRLVVLIALGILLASFIGCVASLTLTGAVLKGTAEALNPNNPNYDRLVKSTAKEIKPFVIQRLQPLIPPPSRAEIIRQNSERAVIQARKEEK